MGNHRRRHPCLKASWTTQPYHNAPKCYGHRMLPWRAWLPGRTPSFFSICEKWIPNSNPCTIYGLQAAVDGQLRGLKRQMEERQGIFKQNRRRSIKDY